MGVGGNFWEALKPYGRKEGYDYLRDKKVAVDLSYWIVQHETALKATRVRNPHLRLTFFRTINLFSKFGAYPVFIVDGKPSPLKSEARIARFFRSCGIDEFDLPKPQEGISVERNKYFLKCVEKCVELLKLLGMPVLEATSEAEALCAKLNSDGLVDACITADSDAFLYGAKCVIKHVDPSSKEPFECYLMEDIEAGLGLRRKQLIAVSLLVGNDHNFNGVQGVGLDTALRFVRNFSEDEVLERLHQIGSGVIPRFDGRFGPPSQNTRNSDDISRNMKPRHCSICGHPGSKTIHNKVPCELCNSIHGVPCCKKPPDFKCECSACAQEHAERLLRKSEDWNLRVCKKIAVQCNSRNNEISKIYLQVKDDYDVESPLSWSSPELDSLVDFLGHYLHWEPFYIRQHMLLMFSTIFLRDMASNPSGTLLNGQFEFDSILRLKVRLGHEFYVVKWKRSTSVVSSVHYPKYSEESTVALSSQHEVSPIDESSSGLDELRLPQFHMDGGCCFILTDENVQLVQKAFPEKVDHFWQKKESKRRKGDGQRTPNSRGSQLAITDYYRSSKPLNEEDKHENLSQNAECGYMKGKSKISNATLPKSVRRRLLFG